MTEEDAREPEEVTEDVVEDSDNDVEEQPADERPASRDEEPKRDTANTKLLSQEEVDRILQKRLKRQEEQFAKRYADYDQLKADAEEFRKLQDEKRTDVERLERERDQLLAQLQERDEKLTKLERANLIADLATERGLPKSMWKRVQGETEEEIAEDIDSIINDLNLAAPKAEAKDGNSKDETPKKKPAPKKVYGGGGETEDPEPDIAKIVAAIPRGPQVRTR